MAVGGGQQPAGQDGYSNVAWLAQRAISLQCQTGERVLIGIAGQPGSGKSTLAAAVACAIGSSAVAVPMDGFHLTNAELDRLQRRERKGAPDTFDVGSFLTLLRRLRSETTHAVRYPGFDRVPDEPVPDAGSVGPTRSIVIVEGNYLLSSCDGWHRVRPLLDEIWYVALERSERVRRLVQRHEAFGKSVTAATAWAEGPDEANARLIDETRGSADLVVHLDPRARLDQRLT